jgi:hypothetical protein
VAREHYYFWRVRALVYAAQELHAVHAGHVNVAEKNVDVAFLKTAQGSLAVGRNLHAMAHALKLFLYDQS